MKLDVVPTATRSRAALLMGGAAAIYLGLRLAGFHALFSKDSEGIGALLEIIGTLYSVVYAFATYVIWGQFADVENEILKEAGALKELILFTRPMREVTRDPVVRAVRAYARGVVESEWGTLSRGESTERTGKLFSAILSSIAELKPADAAEHAAQERLLEIANRASARRDERIALSVKRIPRTLLLFVTLTACAILFLLLFYPFRNFGLGMVAIALITLLLFFAHFVLTDLDNPFEGAWNVDCGPFNELISYR